MSSARCSAIAAALVSLAIFVRPGALRAQEAPPAEPVAPAAPSPEPNADGPVTVDFTADPSLKLYARPAGDAGPFTLVCAAPCSAKLPRGHYAFALGRGDEEPRPAARLNLAGSGGLAGTYTSMNGYRIGGAAVLIGGLSLATYLLLSANNDVPCDPSNPCATSRAGGTSLLLGIATAAASLGIGGWMLSRRDKVTLSIVPGVAQAVARGEGASTSGWSGLTVRARF